MPSLQINAPFPYHAPIESRVGQQFLLSVQIEFVCVDTSSGPVTVNLAEITHPTAVIKDISGNATANPITLTGTVDGDVNPTIAADYGVLKIFSYKNTWQSW